MSETPPGRGAEERDADDWLAAQGDLDWLADARGNGAARGETKTAAGSWYRGGSGPSSGQRAGVATGRSPAHLLRIARQRPILVAGAAALVLVAAIVTVIATAGGGSKPRPAAVNTTPQTPTTTPGPTATQPATRPTRPAARTPARPARARPSTPAAPLKLTLPAGGKLSIGDSGPAVVTLQKVLRLLGLSVGKPDGHFGPRTEAAVIAFQKGHGLTPDGVVGPATAKKLNAALAGPKARG